MLTVDPQTGMLDLTHLTGAGLAKTIDHSLLKPELTAQDVVTGCALAARYHVATVCVKPCHVALAREHLAGSDVLVSTVIGFPHGSHTTATKLVEAHRALDDGAVELDMVINIGALRGGEDALVREDIAAVCRAAHLAGAKVKVILENAYLTDEEKVRGCRLAEAAGADWVKTSTGFAPTGCTVADLRLMRASVSPRVQVKAAHGIRTLPALLEALEAGATRVGATATSAMLDAWAAEHPEEAPPG